MIQRKTEYRDSFYEAIQTRDWKDTNSELQSLVDVFCELRKQIPFGKYLSINAAFELEYFADNHTAVRVSNKTGIVEISKKHLDLAKVSDNLLYYMVIWGFIRYGVITDVEADHLAIKHYLTTERPQKELVIEWMSYAKEIATPELNIRANQFMQVWKQYTKETDED